MVDDNTPVLIGGGQLTQKLPYDEADTPISMMAMATRAAAENAQLSAPMLEKIDTFLQGANTVTVPYRENRALMFHSNLFHASDCFTFREGYRNRRMNVTLLFGDRD